MKYDERSGKGEASIIPNEIKGWNWGAAGLTWIWGVPHGVWISLLVLIPFVNIIMWIFLGLKGNEWAWKKQQWESVEKFISYQNKWKPWGIAFFILGILGLLFIMFGGE
ncbi:ribonuclease G [Candidatus Uhrbacteria bacterium CG_4_10_14_0_2_um_filter_41_7]|uniref:Ribonuclease G n=1 Tax=Candidatus Uhrbacteria bacterium CG_4_9_14_3_um_filter_41_35 TaxID=1975034 RepID=A0A2M7XGK9_9BACT|nr:MAG: ribonuclease G [Candidatus Uhrbacteria bacterium CG11_big_fil_rev_8_21_14_0_20_41_9]PIZ55563.1 MAG: ribonuclease G [Candidatus Uhrbacteria bacterium CG_4_10_14_0_2_um_filter_41_7]PJA46989.1 MAG: ribonuclease G [Candidatus Uhrbacteria bacterium CG_4_9_14_3_um_filter_41_35]